MDRPYSSKRRKNQELNRINAGSFKKLKALQSDVRLVSPFAGSTSKQFGEANKQKTFVSNISVASYSKTCAGTKPEAKEKRSGTNLKTTTITDKKCSLPSIKAPLLTNTEFQLLSRIKSASNQKISAVKAVSTTILPAVSPRPIGGDEKPNTIWRSGKIIITSSSTSSLDGTAKNQTPVRKAVPTKAKKTQVMNMASDTLISPRETAVMEDKCFSKDHQLPTPIESSAAQQPQDILEKREKLCHNFSSRYDYTPLKMIIDELFSQHHDTLPSETCPLINRSPYFVGDCSDEGGLLSGKNSPKLDIPCRRYCSRLIHQHPLDKYVQRMKKPILRYRDVYKSDQDDGGSHPITEVYTPDQLADKLGEKNTKVSKQDSLLKIEKKANGKQKSCLRTSYLESYKKKRAFNSSPVTTTRGCSTRGNRYSVLPIEQPAKTNSYLEIYKKTKNNFLPTPKSNLTWGTQYSVLPPIGARG